MTAAPFSRSTHDFTFPFTGYLKLQRLKMHKPHSRLSLFCKKGIKSPAHLLQPGMRISRTQGIIYLPVALKELDDQRIQPLAAGHGVLSLIHI